MEITTSEQLYEVIKQGEANRFLAATDMNEASSRSHTVLFLVVEQVPDALCAHPSPAQMDESGFVKKSRICFGDLAGSERVARTNAEGQTLEEV